MVLSLPGLSPMRYAAAKRRVWRINPLQMTTTPKPKTFSAILKILEILIQNRALGVNFTLKPVGEKTQSIASLHDDILPPGAIGYFGGILCRQGHNDQ